MINEEYVSTKENREYLSKQIVTYIGNKRRLLEFIGKGLDRIKVDLNTSKLSIFDVFSGSGIVARYLKQYSNRLVVNDLELYSQIINSCYLSNKSEINLPLINEYYLQLKNRLDNQPLKSGFISDFYTPKCDKDIKNGERVFYTTRNGKYIDSARQYIEELPCDYQNYFLAPLLSEASIHANTSGVFKGFYKDSKKGVGKFGGNRQNALKRILGDINIAFPLFSNFECDVEIHSGDSNIIIDDVDEVDVAYLDPPYNQHPYGSNYFMLNLISEYKVPSEVSLVSGIPIDWNRSLFNNKKKSFAAFEKLVSNIKAKYLLISFNSEGFISLDEMVSILKKIGSVDILETKYNAFRGSRNLNGRNIHVKEYLYLVKKF